MRKVILIVVIVIAAYLVAGNTGVIFAIGQSLMDNTYEKHNVSKENFASTSIEKNSAIANELRYQLSLLQWGFFSNDIDALKLLLNTKINFLLAVNKINEVNNISATFANERPSCKEGGEVWIANKLLTEAKNYLLEAKENAKKLSEKYPNYASKAGVSADTLSQLVSKMASTLDSTSAAMQLLCRV